MKLVQFKYPVAHVCLAGAVVVSWSLKQEVAGSSPFNDKNFVSLKLLNSVKTFRKIFNVFNAMY